MALTSPSSVRLHFLLLTASTYLTKAAEGHTHNAELIVPTAGNVTDPAGFNNPKAPMYGTYTCLLVPKKCGISYLKLNVLLLRFAHLLNVHATSHIPVVQGAAGHFEGLDSLFSPNPPYIAWANDTLYSFSNILFKDRHHLEVQFIESDTGAVLHSATLYKKH